MSRTFALAVERVADDRRFADRFRRDPRRALRRYRLDDDQVEAIKSGDLLSLHHHGLDIEKFQRGDRHGWRPYWRKAVVGVTVIGAVIGLAGSPAAAQEVCKIGTCPGPRIRFTGLRRAGRASDGIRLGRALVERSSIRYALARQGVRAAPGRIAVRAALRDFCVRLNADCVLDGPELSEPILIAEALSAP